MLKIPYKIKRICTKILRIILIFSVIASILSVSCLAAGYYGNSFSSLFGTPIVSISTANDGTVNGQVWYRDIVDTDNNVTYEGMEVSAYTAGGTTIESIKMMFVDGDPDKFSGTPLNPSDVVIFTGRIGFAVSSALPTRNFDVDDFKIYFSSSELVDAGSSLVLADSAESVTVESIRFDALDGSGVKLYRVCWVDFSVQYQLPTNHTKYTYPQLYLEFTFDSTYSSWTCFLFDDINWYMGDLESAPLHPEFDSSALDDLENKEDGLIAFFDPNQVTVDLFTEFGDVVNSQAPLGDGLYVASQIFTLFYDKFSWARGILIFSLTLGSIMIILGIVEFTLRKTRKGD